MSVVSQLLRVRQYDWRTMVRLCAALAVALMLMSFASAGVLYMGASGAGLPGSLGEALVLGMSDWLPWPIIIPVVIWLAREFPIERTRWAGGFLAHVTASVAVALVMIAATLGICYLGALPYGGSALWETKLNALAQWFHFNVLAYWVIVAGVHAVAYQRRLQRRQVEATQFKAELTRSQLNTLRMQLRPHFLFNALHTIAVNVRESRDSDAVDMIADLGDLLRTSLDQGDAHEISLADEIQFARKYLEIERVRFADRLRVEFNVTSEATRAYVPTMILQPLVENAVRHGFADDPGAGLIEIHATREGGELLLRVRDNGPGFDVSAGGNNGCGVGLANVAVRLEHLYGDGKRLVTENHKDGGAMVSITIPWHESPLEIDECSREEL